MEIKEAIGHVIATGIIAIIVLEASKGFTMSWSNVIGAFTIGAMFESALLMIIYILKDKEKK